MLRHNTILAFKLTLIISFLGSILSSWQNYEAFASFGWKGVFNGLIDGFLIGGLLCFYKLILADVILRRFFGRLSFGRTLLLNSLLYSLLILLGRAVGRFFMETDYFVLIPTKGEIEIVHFYQSVVVAILFSVFINFLLQINNLLGQRVFTNLITGRYHHPLSEERIILFMDLKSSTAIAEKLGDEKYLEFLGETFSDLTEAIIQTKAEIYKYVGDEIILSWSFKNGVENSNCVKLPLLVEAFFKKNSKEYQERYGQTPQFRTGVHCGEIVIGELGVLKREIALIGDVMNTSARIASYCREYGCNLLISSNLKHLLNDYSFFELKSLGSINLRGKAEAMELFAISSNSSIANLD